MLPTRSPQATITQSGKPVGEPVTTAGLKFKVPFIGDVNPIDWRVLGWDGNPPDMSTNDKLYIPVDLFARWRITDPLQYFLRLHDKRSSQSRLDDILGSETRNRPCLCRRCRYWWCPILLNPLFPSDRFARSPSGLEGGSGSVVRRE